MANSVTGAASLLKREVLDYALPFPPRQFSHFHDHWIGLTARAAGRHHLRRAPALRLRPARRCGAGARGGQLDAAAARPARLAARRTRRSASAAGGCTTSWTAAVSSSSRPSSRCAAAIACRPLGAAHLTRFARAERSPVALAGLARRAARELLGESETLGAEIALFFAFVWRRLVVAATAGLERPRRRLRIDARPPMTLLPTPGRRDPNNVAVGTVGAKIAPLELAVRDDAPPRVNLLIPDDRSGALLRWLHHEAEPGPPAGRARSARPDRDRRPGADAARHLAPAARVLQRAGRRVRPGGGRVRPRVARGGGEPLGPVRGHHLVDRPHRAQRARVARRRALPLPDPGVRAVHLSHGDLRRAGHGLLPAAPLRALLQRAAARLLPPPWDRGVRRRARGRRRRLGLIRERDHGGRAALGARARPARHPAAPVLRPPGAPRGTQHVRAGRAGAWPSGGEGGVRRGLGAARDRHGGVDAPHGARRRRRLRAAAAPRAGRLRRRAA